MRLGEDALDELAREGCMCGASDGDAAREVGRHPEDDVRQMPALERKTEVSVERVSALQSGKSD